VSILHVHSKCLITELLCFEMTEKHVSNKMLSFGPNQILFVTVMFPHIYCAGLML